MTDKIEWLTDANGNRCSVSDLRDQTRHPTIECIVWKGYKDPKGYGRVWYDGRYALAHRVAYQLYAGTIPRGRCICHKCDNPPCINPAHLFLATQAENIRDCERKGRRARGEKCGRAKLTEADVQTIRGDDRSTRLIASDYGIAASGVERIKNRKMWSHVL